MEKEFGMQELYFVQLKTTSPIEVNGKIYAAGEVVASFDKILIANFNDIHKEIAAQGGYMNRKLVVWKRTEGVKLVFTQGIFSKTQFSLMTNSKAIGLDENERVLISQRDEVETDENGIITLTHTPASNWIFVYNKETGEKLTDLTRISGDEIQTSLVYTDVIVDYQYAYNNGALVNFIGEEIFEGYLTLEGRSRVKDDITGKTRTMIIYIPRLKITSDFNLTLGQNAQPMVGKFNGTALPLGNAKESKALEIYFLEDDIDEDSEWR